MNIAFLGVGNVGSPLADQLAQQGHTVTIAARNPESASVKAAQAQNNDLLAKPVVEAVSEADIVFLATPYEMNEAALKSAGDLSGKVLVDCTNPVSSTLGHGLDSKTSGAEMVQQLAPAANVVKAFTIYGFENFQDTRYPGYRFDEESLKPAMLIAGNNAAAKETVGELCEQLGWECVDTGGLDMSLHLEHMTLLWIKMARVQGKGSDFVWAKLRR